MNPSRDRRIMSGLNGKGFTLVETLVALAVVSAVVLSTSLWLHKNRTNQAAFRRFEAIQELEMRMNRAFLLKRDRRLGLPATGEQGWQYRIRLEKGDGESILLGAVEDRHGKTIVELQVPLFSQDP